MRLTLDLAECTTVLGCFQPNKGSLTCMKRAIQTAACSCTSSFIVVYIIGLSQVCVFVDMVAWGPQQWACEPGSASFHACALNSSQSSLPTFRAEGNVALSNDTMYCVICGI
jgi:hypothetical protein